MGRYATILNGIVSNIVIADENFATKNSCVPANGAKIGDLWDGVSFASAPKKQKTLNDIKQEREPKIKDIVVKTAAGNVYNGDDKSQQRMLLAIQCINGGSTRWVMADETIKDVTATELKEALKLIWAAVSEIHLTPYQL